MDTKTRTQIAGESLQVWLYETLVTSATLVPILLLVWLATAISGSRFRGVGLVAVTVVGIALIAVHIREEWQIHKLAPSALRLLHRMQEAGTIDPKSPLYSMEINGKLGVIRRHRLASKLFYCMKAERSRLARKRALRRLPQQLVRFTAVNLARAAFYAPRKMQIQFGVDKYLTMATWLGHVNNKVDIIYYG